MTSEPKGLRARKKRATRKAFSNTAIELFRTQGFNQTTVDEIAEAVGVSPRTFFRYFDSKEAVLFGDWRGMIASIADGIACRPPDEAVWTTLREVALTWAREYEASRDKALFIRHLAETSISVNQYELGVVRPEAERQFTAALGQRLGDDTNTDPRPALFAATFTATLTAAKNRWLGESPDTSLLTEVERAFSDLADLLTGETHLARRPINTAVGQRNG